MPLFHKSPRATSDNTTHTHNTLTRPEKKKGILSRSSRTNDNTTHNARFISSSPDRKRGIFTFNRRTSSSSAESESHTTSTSSSSRRPGIFGNRLRNNKSRSIDHDPSIIIARQKVSEAEQAEKDVDRALLDARNQVQHARDHIRTLEQEAIEEARIAKLKQKEAKAIHNTAKSLGRHGP